MEGHNHMSGIVYRNICNKRSFINIQIKGRITPGFLEVKHHRKFTEKNKQANKRIHFMYLCLIYIDNFLLFAFQKVIKEAQFAINPQALRFYFFKLHDKQK